MDKSLASLVADLESYVRSLENKQQSLHTMIGKLQDSEDGNAKKSFNSIYVEFISLEISMKQPSKPFFPSKQGLQYAPTVSGQLVVSVTWRRKWS